MNKQDLLPGLGHLSGVWAKDGPLPLCCAYFDGFSMKAFDDVLMISIPFEQDEIVGGFPGGPLKSWLSSCIGSDVKVGKDKDGFCRFKEGRSSFRSQVLSVDSYSFVDGEENPYLQIGDVQLMQAIKFVSRSMGVQADDIWRMGVTICSRGTGKIDVFATDNVSMSRSTYATEEEAGSDTFECALSPRFVRMLLKLDDSLVMERFEISENVSECYFEGGVHLWGRNLSEVDVDTYRQVWNSSHTDRVGSGLVEIPVEAEGILKSLISFSTSGSSDGFVDMDVKDGKISFSSVAFGSKSSHYCEVDKGQPDVTVCCDPKVLIRHLAASRRFLLTDGSVLFNSVEGSSSTVAVL